MTVEPLPDYSQPPVVETVVGIQFEPLSRFSTAHLGAFWKALGAEWPHVSDAPPLEPQFEQFGESVNWGKLEVQLRVMKTPSARLQIRSAAGDRMIQVQNGRFHLNWLGHGGDEYPRYARIRDEFVDRFRQFREFVRREGLGDLQPNQWEVTYVNHMPRGTVWNGPEDWTFFLPLGQVTRTAAGAPLESFGGEWHFLIPPNAGRLHVQWRHGRQSGSPELELIVLTLTARGPIQQAEDESQSIAGLDLGRETIVRSFQAFTSTDANRYWGLKHGNA